MVVKIDVRLISSFCLVCIITNVVPSNPDSEIVQGEAKSTVKRSPGSETADEPRKLAVITDRYSEFKILEPIYTNVGVFWREVASSSGGERIRIRNQGTYVDVSTINSNNRTVHLKPITSDRQNGNRPNVNQLGNNAGVTSDYGGNAANRNVPNENGANNNMRNGNIPNGNYPNIYGYNRNGYAGYGYSANSNVANHYRPEGNSPNGNMPNRNGLQGNSPNGNMPNRNGPEGNSPNGNMPNRNGPEGNFPNGNSPNGYEHRNVANGYGGNSNLPNRNGPNGNVPNGNGQNGYPYPTGNTPKVYEPNGYAPNGNSNRPNVNGQDGKVTGDARPRRPTEGNRGPVPPKNGQNNFGGTSPDTTRPKKISPDANLFATIVNNFAFKMVETMNIETNFVVSPLSIFTALSMSYLGAAGRTKSQLERILGLDDYAVHDEPLHKGISDLLSMISPESNEYKLFVANALFFGLNFTVEEPFKENVKNFYNAELKNLDFSDQVGSLNAINGWVANKSKDTIPTLINSPLDVNTRLLLLTAMFFKGKWKTPFPQQHTTDKYFFAADGSERRVPFMKLYRGTFPHYRSAEYKHNFIRLPYLGDQMSMVIALPFGRDKLPMPTITDQILCHMRDAMKNKSLTSVSVPRFRLEYLGSLTKPLEKMGLMDLFSPSVDLTNMRKENDLFVSEILHKAGIDVHEKGTTASAVTEVQYVGLSGKGEDFNANHPFAFYIVHEDSGLVLFYGKILDIEESST